MKKKLYLLATLVLLILSMCINASAAETRLITAKPTLTFNGTTAYCSVTITAAGKDIDATMELWRGNTLVDSWSNDGTTVVQITGNCAVTKGAAYTLTVTGTVGGETISAIPVTKTC